MGSFVSTTWSAQNGLPGPVLLVHLVFPAIEGLELGRVMIPPLAVHLIDRDCESRGEEGSYSTADENIQIASLECGSSAPHRHVSVPQPLHHHPPSRHTSDSELASLPREAACGAWHLCAARGLGGEEEKADVCCRSWAAPRPVACFLSTCRTCRLQRYLSRPPGAWPSPLSLAAATCVHDGGSTMADGRS